MTAGMVIGPGGHIRSHPHVVRSQLLEELRSGSLVLEQLDLLGALHRDLGGPAFGVDAMPESKHRRKNKPRPRQTSAAILTMPSSMIDVRDLRLLATVESEGTSAVAMLQTATLAIAPLVLPEFWRRFLAWVGPGNEGGADPAGEQAQGR